ncbi:MAG TPA: LLM class flavin-dependent oxidoreductase [Acidimicrobiales bacterium]|nr:LLM class flavin-dependent oxidoreductase [Acidimicrobiales bacterium]
MTRSRSDAAEFVEFCRRLEDAGFFSIGFGDHLDDRPSPIAAIAAAAAHTTTLRVGVLVLCNEFRNHALIAQEARTLQVLSEGRVEFGLGVGWMARDFETAGIAPRSFDERLARLRVTVGAVRAAFSPDRDVSCPPLIIGGGGPKMLQAAAELADIVTVNIPLLAGASVAANTIAKIGEEHAVRNRIQLVRLANPAVEIQLNFHEVYVGDDWQTFASRRASDLGMSEDSFSGSPHVLVGSVPLVVDTLRERAEILGVTYWSMTGAAMEMMTPVVARL